MCSLTFRIKDVSNMKANPPLKKVGLALSSEARMKVGPSGPWGVMHECRDEPPGTNPYGTERNKHA